MYREYFSKKNMRNNFLKYKNKRCLECNDRDEGT